MVAGLLDEAITSAAGSAASAVAWSHRGQLRVTVVAKASFAFASDADMPRLPADAIRPADVHFQKNPARSVRYASELAPYRRRVDVVLTGHTQPPVPGPVPSLLVRFCVIDDGKPVLDKSILAREPAGFERIPLVYERAYGGLGIPDNPHGVGAATGDTTAPSLLDPTDPTRPAGFAPFGSSWPARKRLLGKTPRRLLDADIARIPDDFEWGYYQTAPADQQLARLGGGAWILLEGVCAGRRHVRMRLPDVRGLAYVYGLEPEARPLELTIDTVHVDADEERCHVVLRGNLPVPNEAALGALRIVAGVASAGAPVTWPGIRPVAAVGATLAPQGSTGQPDGTMVLDDDELLEVTTHSELPAGTMIVEEQAHGAPLPFQGRESPLAQAPPQRELPLPMFSGRIMLDPEEEEALAARRHVVPFAGGAQVLAGTTIVEEEAPGPLRPAAPLPFQGRESPLAQATPQREVPPPMFSGTIMLDSEEEEALAARRHVVPFAGVAASAPRPAPVIPMAPVVEAPPAPAPWATQPAVDVASPPAAPERIEPLPVLPAVAPLRRDAFHDGAASGPRPAEARVRAPAAPSPIAAAAPAGATTFGAHFLAAMGLVEGPGQRG